MKNSFPRELGLLLLLALIGMMAFLWVCDDAFISFRFSKNLAEYSRIQFNVESTRPIEGYSNLLWVLVAAVFERNGVAAPVAMPIISMFCGLFLLIRVWMYLRDSIGLENVWCSLVLLTLIAFPPFLIWCSSGLATMPFALVIFLLFEKLLGRDGDLHWALILAATISASLLRVEGICWVIVLVCMSLLFFPERRVRALLLVLLPALAAVGVQLIFRYWYYGEYLPNTVNAKVGFSTEVASRGGSYVMVFLLTYLSPLVIFLAALYELFRSRSRDLLLCITVFTGFYMYAVLVGGDFMSMGRFLVPSFALQSLLLGYVLHALKGKDRSRFFSVLLLVVLVSPPLLTTADVYLVPQTVRAKFHFRLNKSRFVDEMDHWRFMVKNSKRWGELGRALGEHTQPGETLVAGAIGNIGYYSKLTILDRYGLVTRLERKKKQRLRSPGHDARVGEGYFLRYEPTYLRAKLKPEFRLSEVVKQRNKTPYPYAPVIYMTDARTPSGERKLLILMKRMDESEDYERAWSNLEKGWT